MEVRGQIVDGIGGAVVGMACGGCHSWVITTQGRVLSFGGEGSYSSAGNPYQTWQLGQ